MLGPASESESALVPALVLVLVLALVLVLVLALVLVLTLGLALVLVLALGSVPQLALESHWGLRLTMPPDLLSARLLRSAHEWLSA